MGNFYKGSNVKCKECEQNPVVKQDGRFFCVKCFSEWLQIFGEFYLKK